MGKFNYDKLRHSKKQSESSLFDKVDKPKKLTSKQKQVYKKRGQKTRFVNGVAERLQSNTPASELWFKAILEANNLSSRFLGNIPLNNMIPDFINLDKKIIVEVDGNVHLTPEQIQRDLRKDKEYSKLGYTCLRVVYNDNEQALQVIQKIQELIG